MGDISRHRDIYLNTREAIPAALLDKCKLKKSDLTYLEMGNYLTDVSQFRDPVMYIFSKQRIWREFILPKVGERTETPKVIAALIGAAGLLSGELLKRLTSGIPSDIGKYGPTVAALGGLLAAVPDDLIARIIGADDWIDKMFGTPIEKTIGDPKKRDQKHYGYIGQFFQYFIEGITHLIFAADVTHKVKGEWGKIDRISASRVTDIFSEFFTQYYPHEHTDQPPYEWDASQRPKNKMYQPSTRQRSLKDPDIGVMNAVDNHYVQYLSEGLADLEQDWKRLKPGDETGRQKMLVRMGKLLHGVEDWYFHSNVVELYRICIYRSKREDETAEQYLVNFVKDTASKDPEFITTNPQPVEQLRLQRRLYRRLRFPAYERGNCKNSGGVISKTKPSTLALHHAYPAFPSQQDTAHTIMHALENLERKTHPRNKPHGRTPPEAMPSWVPCVFQKFTAAKGTDAEKLLDEKAKARGVDKLTLLADLTSPGGPKKDNTKLIVADVLREWIPLVLTLLYESERQRLVANIDPLKWPVNGDLTLKPEEGKKKDFESDEQLKRHKKALKPKLHHDGVTENNYDRLVRYLVECGFLNTAGKDALKKAFAIDHESDNLLEDAPGAGGFLIKFSLELQAQLDGGDKAVAELNKDKDSVFNQASDNSAFNEIVGSHSLMSKDTLQSPPFFEEAKVFASLASSSIFHIMLDQLSSPTPGRRLPWKAVLHYFIRYPVANNGWERKAMAFYNRTENKEKIPTHYSDLPEIASMVAAALRSKEAEFPWSKGEKDNEMQNRYIELEAKLSKYRYPC